MDCLRHVTSHSTWIEHGKDASSKSLMNEFFDFRKRCDSLILMRYKTKPNKNWWNCTNSDEFEMWLRYRCWNENEKWKHWRIFLKNLHFSYKIRIFSAKFAFPLQNSLFLYEIHFFSTKFSFSEKLLPQLWN